MLGPALLKYGSEEQKKRFLPEIARGEIRWCQGYSEPGAGSDLAGLQTKCEDKGDHWLVNGQKVWTSYADKADWIFCLVRTDPPSPSTRASASSCSTWRARASRPSRSCSSRGNSPFCETFFDDVKVPKDQLVGEVNKGWDVAKYLLGHEREMISGMGLGGERIARRSRSGRSTIRCCAPTSPASTSTPGLPRDVRALHRRIEGGRGASGPALDDEICRHRIEQAPPRAGHGRGRLATRSNGTASARKRARRRANGSAPRPIRSRAAPAKSSSASSPSISCSLPGA